MARFVGIRKGRREASDNLSYTEGGDCPRCGGEAQNSTQAISNAAAHMNGLIQITQKIQ